MSKPREFKAVSMLRNAKDSSDENYSQETFNPRLHLIEKSAADKLAEALADVLEHVDRRDFPIQRMHDIETALKEYKGKP